MKHTDLSQFPDLNAEPNPETRKARAIQKIADEANLLVELLDRVKVCTGLRAPDKWGDQYSPTEHLRLIEAGQYQKALNLITTRGT